MAEAHLTGESHQQIESERGERDAPRMGRRLKARHARPGLLLTSHAARALRTARLLAEAFGFRPERLKVDEALYLASPDALLSVIGALDDEHSCVLLVGHNPGLTDLVNRLLPDLALDNLPTSGAVAIDFQAKRWQDVSSAAAKLAYYDYPANPELLVTEN